jgi:hypothetical protein
VSIRRARLRQLLPLRLPARSVRQHRLVLQRLREMPVLDLVYLDAAGDHGQADVDFAVLDVRAK